MNRQDAKIAKLKREERKIHFFCFCFCFLRALGVLAVQCIFATNNLAERETRPAVIARKLSAGNRTEAGAETNAVLASILRTCRRQGRSILDVLGELLRRGPGHVIRLQSQPRPATPTSTG